MKKLLPLLLIVAIGIAGWFVLKNKKQEASTTTASTSSTATTGTNATTGTTTGGTTQASAPVTGGVPAIDPEDQEQEEMMTRPATELYKSSDDALEAVKKGATTYDDLVLEQFTQLGDNCSWCDTFYKSVSDTVLSAATKPDEKSYYSEILAISGRVDNVKTLVEAAKGAQKPEDAQIYNEAIELSVGKDDLVNYFASELGTTNEPLKEAMLAAVTNQGSRPAFDVLYKQTVERGDPDGFYSNGYGVGEMILAPEAFPVAQEAAQKRDQFSHLPVKALLNSGVDGLRSVFDILATSKDPDADKRLLLKDALEHVSYDEETENLVNKLSETAPNPVVKEFASEIKKEFAALTEDESGTADEE